jgi:hypothetical protein
VSRSARGLAGLQKPFRFPGQTCFVRVLVVRQVADQHGAQVLVESPPDGGTRVRLRFSMRP